MPRVPFLCSQTWVSFPSDINPAVPETWYSSLLDNWIHDLLYANSCPCSYLLAWQKLTVASRGQGSLLFILHLSYHLAKCSAHRNIQKMCKPIITFSKGIYSTEYGFVDAQTTTVPSQSCSKLHFRNGVARSTLTSDAGTPFPYHILPLQHSSLAPPLSSTTPTLEPFPSAPLSWEEYERCPEKHFLCCSEAHEAWCNAIAVTPFTEQTHVHQTIVKAASTSYSFSAEHCFLGDSNIDLELGMTVSACNSSYSSDRGRRAAEARKFKANMDNSEMRGRERGGEEEKKAGRKEKTRMATFPQGLTTIIQQN